MEHYKCNKCSRFYFGVSQSDIKKQINDFNKYFKSLSSVEKAQSGWSLLTKDDFEYCYCKNSFMNFSKETIPQKLYGSTISGIAMFDEVIKIKQKTKLKDKILKIK